MASLLLVLTCLMAVGVVCTCSSDQSLQSIQKTVHSAGADAVQVDAWRLPLIATGVLLLAWLLVIPTDARGRASPERLQRFLF